jgi:hypothetical protein
MRFLALTVGLVASALVGACGSAPLVVCDAVAVTAIQLRVVDALTGTPTASQSSVIVVYPAGGTDTLRAGLTPSYDSAVFDIGVNPGTYRLTLRKPGYGDWSNNAVVVGADGCRAVTVNLVAAIQKSP